MFVQTLTNPHKSKVLGENIKEILVEKKFVLNDSKLSNLKRKG